MKIYVATQKDVEEHKVERLAEGSMEKLKRRLRDFGNTNWTIRTYQFKPTRETVCNLIEGVYGQPETTESVRINAQGQVRSA